MAPFVLNGPINREAFETYVARVLVPELATDDVVIMDNLSSHKGPRVREMIDTTAPWDRPVPKLAQARMDAASDAADRLGRDEVMAKARRYYTGAL